jgi:alcohol dehydrogenase class IV
VDDFILGLGMPHRIRDLEIPEEDLPAIADAVLADGGCRSNPVPVTTTDQVMQVLTKAY